MKKSKKTRIPKLGNKLISGLAAIPIAIISTGCFADDNSDPELDRFEQALELKPEASNGRDLYDLCVACHSPEGWGSVNGSYPQIAGQLYTVTIKQLSDIFSRKRGNPIMEAFTSSRVLESAQDIADLAAYIEELPMTDQNGKGHEDEIELGAKLYDDNCKNCHGKNGEGHLKDHIPRLQGQHYQYLMRQFSWIRGGHRKNADKKMVKQIEHFSLKEQSAVMSYTASLRPPKELLAEPGWKNPDFPNHDRKWAPEAPKYKSLKR